MEPKLRIDRAGDLWVLQFQSRHNTIGLHLLQLLSEALQVAETDPACRGVILAAAPGKFFSPGLDLLEATRLDRTALKSLMELFCSVCRQLFGYPKPTLAAIERSAIGGGAILASCCDFRVARPEIRIGLTKMSRVLPLPFSSFEILRLRVGERELLKMVAGGTNYSATEAAGLGWIDRILGPDESLPDFGQSLFPEVSAGVFRATRRSAAGSRLEEMERREREGIETFLDCWFGEEAQTYLASTVRRLQGSVDPAMS